jgi:hypothetical protein
VDDEYKRCGTANIFLCVEPLSGKTVVEATARRTRIDFAHFLRDLCDGPYRDASKIVIVMDNLNTHSSILRGAARTLPLRRRGLGGFSHVPSSQVEVHYTPKHGSWLDIAEIELSVLARQCLHQRIGSLEELKELLKIWKKQRNAESHTISWRFKTEDARIKLRRLYPVLSSEE